MNNVSDSKSFRYTTTPLTAGLRYVFEFWDGTVEVNTTGQVAKTLNMGGDPASGGNLTWSCTAVDDRGASRTDSQVIIVNNPPVIVQSPQATVNDAVFPYTTQLSLVAYDLEGHNPLSFRWYRDGALVLLDSGTDAGLVAGVYRGVLTGSNYQAYRSSLQCDITQPEMVRVEVEDSQGGITVLNFSLLGRRPTNPYGAPLVETSSLIADATGSARQRVGLYQVAKFVIHTEILEDPPVVSWAFPQYRGWLAIGSGAGQSATVTQTRLPSGAYELVAKKPLDAEPPLFGAAAREATVEVSFAHKGKTSNAVLSVILLPNRQPQDVTVAFAEENDEPITPNPVTRSVPRSKNFVRFIASGRDLDLDLVSYQWNLSLNGGGATLTLRGRTAIVDISATAVPVIATITGTLVATDRFGLTQGNATALPTITVTP